MQVTAEVKTGKRRIIEYLLEPVMKGFKESVRERYGIQKNEKDNNRSKKDEDKPMVGDGVDVWYGNAQQCSEF